MEERRVHPHCNNVSNPLHKCDEYCFKKLAEAKSRIFEKETEADQAGSGCGQSNSSALDEEDSEGDFAMHTGRQKDLLEERKRNNGELLDANDLGLKEAFMLLTQEATEASYEKWEEDWDEIEADKSMMLADDIWTEILSKLPIKELIKFSSNSQRWKLLVQSTKSLYIIDDSNRTRNFLRSVENFLQNFKTGLLRSLRIILATPICPYSVERWLDWLINPLLEELYLNLPNTFIDLPSQIFLLKGLRELTLILPITWILPIPEHISLCSLKTLSLKIKWPDAESLKSICEASAVLTDLRLEDCDWEMIGGLTLTIPSLQRFDLQHHESEKSNRLLKMVFDDLKRLSLHMVMNFNLEFEEMKFLEHADLLIDFLDNENGEAVHQLGELLCSVKNTRTLVLSNCGLKIDEEIHCFMPHFRNVVSLDLSMAQMGRVRWNLLMGVIAKTTNVKILSLPQLEENLDLEDCSIPEAITETLESLDVSNFHSNNLNKEVIRFFLQHSKRLSRVKIESNPKLMYTVLLKQQIKEELMAVREDVAIEII